MTAKMLLGLGVAAFCLAGAATAQKGAVPPPLPKNITAQPPVQSKVLTNPAGVVFKPPVLTGAMLSAEQVRKIGLVRAWGLTVQASALQTPIWLTPQRPFIDAQTNISEVFAGSRMTTTSYTEGLYGTITIPSAPTSIVSMTVGASTPNTWWLVECHVSSNVAQGFQIASFPTTVHAGDQLKRAASIISRFETPVGGKFSVLFEPTASAVRNFQVSPVQPNTQWTFGGCELTPVKV